MEKETDIDSSLFRALMDSGRYAPLNMSSKELPNGLDDPLCIHNILTRLIFRHTWQHIIIPALPIFKEAG